jgi:hypothetical protein
MMKLNKDMPITYMIKKKLIVYVTINNNTMKNRLLRRWMQFVILLPGLVLCNACKDIILVNNIANRTVILIAPGDSVVTDVATQTFWWDSVDYATSYELDVVSPSFRAVERLVVDTMVTGQKFKLTLVPGHYQWRVMAKNSSYQTPFTYSSFVIDSTSSLSSQLVSLSFPPANSYTNLATITFQWIPLYNASQYQVQVKSGSWTGAAVISRGLTANDTMIVTNLAAGTYAWGVQALNNDGASSFNYTTFTIDRTAPGAPTLVSPAGNAALTVSPVHLVWNRATDAGIPLYDSLFVATDSLFSNVAFSLKESVDSAQVSLTSGKYFWKVKTTDAAGNQSGSSAAWKFTLTTN